MMNDILKNRIGTLLPLIRCDVEQIETDDVSVLRHLGCLLFTAADARYTGIYPEAAIDRFAQLINEYEPAAGIYQTFSVGYPSIGIIFRDLVRKEFLEPDEAFEDAIQDMVLAAGRQQLALGNYDLLYGATGLLHYLLAGNTGHPRVQAFLADYMEALRERSMACLDGLAWADYYYTLREQSTGVNLGLAHGMPAILKAWIQIYKCTGGELKKEAEQLMRRTAVFLMNAMNKEKTGISQYGGYWIPGGTEEISRLGWCYGDAGIGFILFQAGQALGDEAIMAFGERLVLATTHRRTEAETMITDAGLCHGSAGIAHLYSRMWQATGNHGFREAAEFWIDKTLNFAVPGEHTAGYSKYNPVHERYERDHGFLEGTAGIGLMLLSYLTGEHEWDYCLMLNG